MSENQGLKGSNNLPAFPNDVPIAPIARISLSKLLANDVAESASTLEACKTYGFFYLDLRSDATGETLIHESEELRDLSLGFFNQPLEEKTKHLVRRDATISGYKPAGSVKTTDKASRPDSTEFWNVAKDHMHGFTESRSYPDDVLASKDLFKSFQKNAHDLGMTCLRTLERQLDLTPGDFTNKHTFGKPAGDHVRLTRKLAIPSDKHAIGLPSHTDFGSVTILFNWVGGLQIESSTSSKEIEWKYVKPLEGHAIINLGDSMVTFTNGLLNSAKHRVVPAPGELAKFDRYSIVYFVRPCNDVLMEPLEVFKDLNDNLKVAGKFEPEGDADKVLTAEEWTVQRANQLLGKRT